MEKEQNGSSLANTVETYGKEHVEEVVRRAQAELCELLRERVRLKDRIGTIRKAIAGLASLFGDGVLTDELLEFGDPKRGNERQRGLPHDSDRVGPVAHRARRLRSAPDEDPIDAGLQ